MMQETRFFRTTSSMGVAAFSLAGKAVSIRQAAILGIGCGPVAMVSLGDIGALYPLLSLAAVPMLFAFARSKTMAADQYIFSLLAYAVRRGSTKRIRAARAVSPARRPLSERLGLRPLEVSKVNREQRIRRIPIPDRSMYVRLRLSILEQDGTPYANKFVSVYLGGERVGAITTDSTGQLAVTVAPGRMGMVPLRVMPRGSDRPILDDVVEFVRA